MKKPVRVVYSPHPLLVSQHRVFEELVLNPGETLEQFLRRSPADTHLPLQVMVDDRRVPRADWRHLRLKPGQIVNARVLLQGGDGSDPLQTALTIGVLLAAPGLGGSVNSFLGLSAGSAVGGALVTVGGMYLVSQLYKPPASLNVNDYDPSPNYSITGGQNRARPGQPLPLVIGTHRVFPDLNSKPYFFHNYGTDQYINQIFNFGLSDLVLSDFKIGDAPLDQFADYYLEESAADGALDDWFGNVDSVTGPSLTVDSWSQLTSSAGAYRLAVDLAGLLFYMGDQGPEPLNYDVHVEYRAVGDTVWIVPPSWRSQFYPALDLISAEGGKPTRISILLPTAGGQYEVRVKFTNLRRRRVTVVLIGGNASYSAQLTPVDISDPRLTANLTWSALRTVQSGAGTYPGQKRVGLEIRANSQFNGQLEAFNAIASASCESWNGSAWSTTQNSNPAWWFRWLAQGKTDANGLRLFGGGYSDNQLDLDTIKAWGAWCDSKGLAVNLVFDQAKNLYDMLAILARCGRASLSWGNGKLGVVYDEANKPASAVFGMANIIAGSFRVDYISGQLPDEIVLNWVNPALGYQPDQVRQTLPGVVNPVNPVEVTIPGITNEAQAGRECNLVAAEQVHRVRTIRWQSDLEGLAVARGDVVTLSHDLNQWAYSGRLLAGTTAVLTLDRAVPFTPAASHYIGLRSPDGSYSIHAVNYVAGESDSITLPVPLAGAPDDDADNVPLDYLWVFEPKATPGKAVKVTDIRPLDEHTVEITATDEDDAYYLAENDAYTHVPLTPGANLPSISNLEISTELVNVGAGYGTRIALAWDVDGDYGGAFVRANFNDGPWFDAGETLDTLFQFTGPERGKVTVEVTAFNPRGQFGGSNALATQSQVYIGRDTPPDDPTGLTVTVLSDGTRQLLPQVPTIPADFAGFLFRARAGTHAAWGDLSIANGGLDLHSEPVKAMPWETPQIPAGTYTLAVKMVDRYGNESANASLVTTTLAESPSSPPGGGNLIFNSLLNPPTEGWDFSRTVPLAPANISVSYETGGVWNVEGGVAEIQQLDAIGDPAVDYARINSDMFPVEPGEWYELSARLAAHRCQVSVFLFFLREEGHADQSLMTAEGGQFIFHSITNTPNGGTSLSNYEHAYDKGQAPAEARRGYVQVRKYATIDGETTSHGFFTQLMACQTSELQNQPTPWAPSVVTLTSNLINNQSQQWADITGTSGSDLSDAVNNVHGIADNADVTDYGAIQSDAQARADAAEAAAAIDAQARADAAESLANAFTQGWSQQNATVGADWDINLANRPADNDLLNSAMRHNADITVTVGTGGDYATVNAALLALSQKFPEAPSTGITAQINMLSGYTLQQQVIINGINLGWVEIVGVDASTPINIVGPSTAFADEGASWGQGYLVQVDNGGIAPIIGQLFTAAGGSVHGFAARGAKSALNIRSGCGYTHATSDIYGIRIIGGAVARAAGAVLKSSNDSVVRAEDGSHIDSRGVTASRFAAVSGSTIVADEATVQDPVGTVIDASGNSRISAEDITLNLNSALSIAVQASGGSQVDIDNATVSITASVTKGAVSIGGSTISAANVNFSGASGNAFEVQTGGIINAASTTGTLSQAANTVTASGLIFK